MSKLKEVSREDLFAVSLPQATDTYVPISNRRLITTFDSMVADHGFEVTSEQFSMTANGQIMLGKFHVKSPGEEIGIMLAVGNSYNKSRRVTVAAGGVVFACLNGMFKGEYVQMRKHTGAIKDDLELIIQAGLETANHNYIQLLEDAETMKKFQIDRRIAAQIVGDMYFNHRIMNSTQLNIIKDNMKFSRNFRMVEPGEFTMWNLYNNITESLKTSHPLNYLAAHRNLHAYVENYMGIGDPYDEMIYEFEALEALEGVEEEVMENAD